MDDQSIVVGSDLIKDDDNDDAVNGHLTGRDQIFLVDRAECSLVGRDLDVSVSRNE